MSILVIGKRGQLARALQRRAAAGAISMKTLARPDIDLEQPEALAERIASASPGVVINAAAYTAVDKAEEDADGAFRVNAAGAEAVARGAAACGAALIHVSTDYVYAGDQRRPYLETDEPAPRTVYGDSKLAGEIGALGANARTIILRTAWVYDAEGANFVRTMLRLAKTRAEVAVVGDQHGCPTFADDLADAALTVALTPRTFGLFHCAGAGETTWSAFADEIFAQSRARGGPSARVKQIASADYPTRTPRPANSRLNSDKLADAYGIRLRDWRGALSVCLDEIAASGWRVE